MVLMEVVNFNDASFNNCDDTNKLMNHGHNFAFKLPTIFPLFIYFLFVLQLYTTISNDKNVNNLKASKRNLKSYVENIKNIKKCETYQSTV